MVSDGLGCGGELEYCISSAIAVSGDRWPGVRGTECGISNGPSSIDGAVGGGGSSIVEAEDDIGWF